MQQCQFNPLQNQKHHNQVRQNRRLRQKGVVNSFLKQKEPPVKKSVIAAPSKATGVTTQAASQGSQETQRLEKPKTTSVFNNVFSYWMEAIGVTGSESYKNSIAEIVTHCRMTGEIDTSICEECVRATFRTRQDRSQEELLTDLDTVCQTVNRFTKNRSRRLPHWI